VSPGDTFVLILPEGADHLWVVCSPPNPDGRHVVFNLSKLRPRSDTACVIQPGEHPYVTVPSVVAYRYGRCWSPKDEDFVRHYPKPSVSPELLLRIQRGALASTATPGYLKKAIHRILNPPG
jgi:hypothetical protein